MYDLMVLKPKKSKWQKIIYTILIVILLIGSAFLGTQLAKKKKESCKEYSAKMEEKANQIEQEKEEQKKISNIEQPLTPEQINNVLNIYANEEKRVFLTFDDGPSNNVTPLILDVLKENNVKATFFVLGNRVRAYSSLINRIYNEGHYIANHGYSHKYSELYASIENAFNEYNMTEQALKEVLKNPNFRTQVFRFPGGVNGGKYHDIKQEISKKLVENSIAYLDWNALTNDAAEKNPTAEKLLENLRVTVAEKNSVVLLMHDASNKALTAQILPQVIQYFKDREYKFCNLYDVL